MCDSEFDKLSLDHRLDIIGDAFERDWRAGKEPCIDDYLRDVSASDRPHAERELRLIAYELFEQSTQALLHGSTASASDASGPAPNLGRYQIVRIIDAGSFGLVYLARDTILERDVAVKVPHPSQLPDESHAELLLSEAKTLARLDHAAIVPIFDCGRTPDGMVYIVSKFIDGGDLATRIAKQPPSLKESLRWMIEVANAVNHAHDLGFVHRDIKPRNILIDVNDSAWIADFGLALNQPQVGQGADLVGTPAYMSPEQARGEADRVGRASDIFSLGVVLYELLTGQRPFRGDSREEILDRIATLDFSSPRDVDDSIPLALERVCLRAMALVPDDRYTTAVQMADDLRGFTARRFPERWHTLAAAACVVGIAVVIAGVRFPSWNLAPNPTADTKLNDRTTQGEAMDDRACAEKILELGGKVEISIDRERIFTSSANLPASSFDLVTINLQSATVDDDSLVFLFHATGLGKLENLKLAGTAVTDGAMQRFGRCRGIRQAWLNFTTIGDTGVALLSDCKEMAHLDLNSCTITDQSGPVIAGFQQLQFLDISDTGVTDKIIHDLTELGHLVELKIQNTKISDDSVELLGAFFKSLRDLDIRGSRITAVGAARLQAHLPDCKVKFADS